MDRKFLPFDVVTLYLINFFLFQSNSKSRWMSFSVVRMYLKIALCQLYIKICGEFAPNEEGIVVYTDLCETNIPQSRAFNKDKPTILLMQ